MVYLSNSQQKKPFNYNDMKKLFLFASILMVSLFSINKVQAQVSLNINIGSQPVWGPTGYDHVDYYYLPAINAYYYVPTGQYIYLNGGRWVWVNNLPAQYNNFDLYGAYKVVINKPRPYLHNDIYLNKYSGYKNYVGRQTIIRDSRDAKYYVVKGHPNYNGNNNRPVKVTRPRNQRPARAEQNNGNHGRPERGNRSNDKPERGHH